MKKYEFQLTENMGYFWMATQLEEIITKYQMICNYINISFFLSSIAFITSQIRDYGW